MRLGTFALLACAGLTLAACLDLDVVNTNAPDRDRALSEPGDIETLAVSAWRDLWDRGHRSESSYNAFPPISDLFTATYANNAALELSSEPRPPLNNHPLSDAHGVARFPWESYYKAISTASDVLFAINDGLRIMTGDPVADNTSRTWSWAKLHQGIAMAHLSMLYDQAFIVNEYSDLTDQATVKATVPLLEYTAVRDTALKLIRVAADSLNAQNWTTPVGWISGHQYTSQQLAQIGYSYGARAMVYGARTPEDRANLDWSAVLDLLDRSIAPAPGNGTAFDYTVTLTASADGFNSSFLSRLQQTGTFSAWGDYKFLGPADTSGNYRAWLELPVQNRDRIVLHTPDRRITGPTNQETCAAGSTSVLSPASNPLSACHGSIFRFRPDNIFRPERGTYHHSHYQWRGNGNRSTSGDFAFMTIDEMNLLRAEALIRLNRAAEAVPLINAYRTRDVTLINGTTVKNNVDPVTVNGVPQSTGCVPRMDGVNCANLLDALQYERLLAIAALDALIGYMDSRGWGRLPSGTFLHMPIPARELEALGMAIYSFGGVGGPGAAQ